MSKKQRRTYYFLKGQVQKLQTSDIGVNPGIILEQVFQQSLESGYHEKLA